MAAQTFVKEMPTVHDFNILAKMQWMGQGRSSLERQAQIKSQGRSIMNPNRFMADLLSTMEAQFYRKQVQLELSQSTHGVLRVNRETANNITQLLMGRILSLTEPQATLEIHWSQSDDKLVLRFKLKPAPFSPLKGNCMPLMPLTPNLMRQLEVGGIRYQADSSSGPWQLIFDCSNI